MIRGAITSHIDVAQVVLYAFFLFFSGLIFYLRREDRREGYPLESEVSGPGATDFLLIPTPKTFLRAHGGTVIAPRPNEDTRVPNATKVAIWPGAPLIPNGDPMKAEVGPGSYALRADVPEQTFDGHTLLVPLRIATNFAVASEDANPVGMAVVGADGVVGGTVKDLWVDRGEGIVRYYEVETAAARHVLLPVTFSNVKSRQRKIEVDAILGGQFADVPGTRDPDSVTMLEEEKVVAYYGAGTLYATVKRAEPLL
jgi:photosynthetic reaction center H subunit